MTAPIWPEVLDQTVRVCAAYGRTDLAQRLQRKRAQLLAPTLRVLIMGEPKQGKSQLVNALVNAPVCPVGGATTGMPTVVHHAETPVATLVRPLERTPVPMAEINARIGTPPPAGTDGQVHAEVGVPRGLLAAGLVLVDSPGLEVPGDDTAESAGSPVTADVVVMVSDATRELSAAELDRLVQVTRHHPYVIVALTKIDIVTGWRQVAERNRKRLAEASVPATLIPVSAALRLRAAQANDKAINTESGFPDLITRLMQYLRTKAETVAPASAGLLIGRIIEELAEPLRAGLAADGNGEPLARLHEAQRALDDLRRCTTKWQNRLADEMADLRLDIEYDLRDRTRRILREADEAFETADPLRTWEEFQNWLEWTLTRAVEANADWLFQRCDWIGSQLADHFIPYGADVLPEWKVELPPEAREAAARIEQPRLESFTLMQKAYAGLRGSYLGVLMFGLATTFAGLPLINPISIGAGLLFAAKGVKDESSSLLKRRQAAAKAAAQRHVDDFFFQLNKTSRDAIHQVQRTLRDHYTALTEQIHDDIVHSLRTAKQAADADVAERDQRHRDLQQQIRQLGALYERAQALTASQPARAVATLEPAA